MGFEPTTLGLGSRCSPPKTLSRQGFQSSDERFVISKSLADHSVPHRRSLVARKPRWGWPVASRSDFAWPGSPCCSAVEEPWVMQTKISLMTKGQTLLLWLCAVVGIFEEGADSARYHAQELPYHLHDTALLP